MKTTKILIIIMLTMISFGCDNKKKDTIEKPVQEKIVKVFLAKPGSFIQTRTVSAETLGIKDITLSSETNGKVEWMKVSVGDTVQAGQLIARIDEQMAKAQLDVASANYNFALSNYERQKQIYDKKIISDQQFDAARTQMETAKAGLKLSQIQMKNTSIYAPFGGIVAASFVNENELTNIGRPVVRIVNLDTIKIVVAVVEQDMTNLHINEKATVEIHSIKNGQYSGSIHKIGFVADPSSKTFPVEILISNPDHTIKAGMVSTVKFTINHYNNVFVVPQDLIVEGEDSKGIMTVSNNVVKLKKVEVALPEKDKIAVLSGISEGDKIIYVGHKGVSDGDMVTIVEN
ncbi:MAG: efflux RND transporter periplasmic adaptor subunit [Candidatus Desantisbacteria bacterium]